MGYREDIDRRVAWHTKRLAEIIPYDCEMRCKLALDVATRDITLSSALAKAREYMVGKEMSKVSGNKPLNTQRIEGKHRVIVYGIVKRKGSRQGVIVKHEDGSYTSCSYYEFSNLIQSGYWVALNLRLVGNKKIFDGPVKSYDFDSQLFKDVQQKITTHKYKLGEEL
ncbi:hypothetical protein D3C81_07010 [compost metagenome]